MSFMDDVKTRVNGRVGSSGYYDIGLRNYMIGVYNYMASALGVSGLVAFLVASSPLLTNLIYKGPLGLIVAILPLVISITMSVRMNTMSLTTAHICFWSFATSMGASLSYIFFIYSGDSIARVFFMAASVFGAAALYGYTTKKDLTSAGSFAFMGLFGIIIAGLFNIFLRSSALMFATSMVAVVVFVVLTAFDMQKIKGIYHNMEGYGDSVMIKKVSLMGALSLYMDFINLFTAMLHFMGNRKD